MKPLSRRDVLKAAGFVAFAGFTDGLFREPVSLRFERFDVRIAGLASEFDGYRITLLSDFHLPSHAGHGLMRRAVALANRFQPDLIAATGDFVHKPADRVPDFTRYFAGLHAPDGVVGCLGNHDHWVDVERVKRGIASQTSIRLLVNESVMVERGPSRLAIVGIDDLRCGGVDVDRAFHGITGTTPRLLLSHNPDFAEEAPDGLRVDLQLSGHTHGGEIRLPLGPAPVIPSEYGQKFREGLVRGKRHMVFVTRGVATVGARI